MRTPRRLSAAEAELWARVAATVSPIDPARAARPVPPAPVAVPTPAPDPVKRPKGRVPPPPPPPAPAPPPPRRIDAHGLDAGWDRRLARGLLSPEFTLDLHGASLDAAHSRLEHGLALALAQGARLVLLITGRPRPQPAADRGEARGAIRAKFVDWLLAGPHAGRIAAIRPAHPRHGGGGAVYIVLRKPRG